MQPLAIWGTHGTMLHAQNDRVLDPRKSTTATTAAAAATCNAAGQQQSTYSGQPHEAQGHGPRPPQ